MNNELKVIYNGKIYTVEHIEDSHFGLKELGEWVWQSDCTIINDEEYKQCSDCGKLLKLSDLKPHNKYEQYNDVFCNECLEHCPVCGVLFADYIESGKCDRCAD